MCLSYDFKSLCFFEWKFWVLDLKLFSGHILKRTLADYFLIQRLDLFINIHLSCLDKNPKLFYLGTVSRHSVWKYGVLKFLFYGS